MTNEEERRKIERKKKLKKKKSEFIRKEKESLIRQKKERRQKKKRRHRKSSILRSLQKYFAELRRQRSHKKKLRKETAYLRKKIRSDRKQYIKKQILTFFRKPFEKKNIKKSEKIRKEIQRGIREQQFNEFLKFPDRILKSYKLKRKRQRIRLSIIRFNFWEAVSGYTLIKEDRGLRLELWKSYFNSAFAFLLAFVTIYVISNLASVFAARYYGIPAVLYSYRIFWPLYTFSSLYSRQALIVIFSAGPLISIFLAVLIFQILKRVQYFRINFKIVLLWMIFHALNLFFGAYIVGVITRTGFVYTTEWLFFSRIFDVEEILFLIISIIALIIWGFYFTRYFLLSSNSNLIISPKIRIFYLILRVLLPWFTGVGLLFILNYPNNPPELILLFGVSFLMIFPVFANYNSIQNKSIKLRFKESKEFVGWIYVLIATVLLGFYRLILFNGISFG